ncbi:MAG TPA: MFS transporter [Streptosporangiaceae bacterium]|nr:MFS transporter [Streptosporangiaceae bacterium]
MDAASFVVSAVTLLLFRSDPAVAGATADSPAGDVTAPAGRQAEGRASGEDKRGKPRLAPLLREPVLISMLIVTLIANFVVAGAFEVALPNLAHLRFGPGGYGALLTCFGAGAVVGTLYAARARPMRMPAVIACCTFIVAGLAVAVIPYAGGLPGAAAGMAAMAAFSSFGNIILITLLQQWAPRELIGRVMGLVMTASAGCYPIAVAMGGLLVHRFGPAPFFPAAGAGLVLAVIGALSRREIRTLGAQVAQLPAQAAAA